MDLHWKNKTKIKLLILILILTSSCRSGKPVAEQNVKETLIEDIRTVVLPFKVSSTADLVVDDEGNIEPSLMKLTMGDVTAQVDIKDSKATYTLESKDTITIDEKIKKVNEKKEVVVENKPIEKLTFWGKFKKFINRIALASLILNVLFVAFKLTRFFR